MRNPNNLIFVQPCPSRLRESLEVVFKYPNKSIKKLFHSRKKAILEFEKRYSECPVCEMYIESFKA